MWDCASQLWVPGSSRAWASVSQFLPHNSATLQFQVLMSMQMDAYLKKGAGRLVPFLSGWGHWKGGLGGGGGRGVQPKNHTCLYKICCSGASWVRVCQICQLSAVQRQHFKIVETGKIANKIYMGEFQPDCSAG